MYSLVKEKELYSFLTNNPMKQPLKKNINTWTVSKTIKNMAGNAVMEQRLEGLRKRNSDNVRRQTKKRRGDLISNRVLSVFLGCLVALSGAAAGASFLG